jgi:hypothetical protein
MGPGEDRGSMRSLADREAMDLKTTRFGSGVIPHACQIMAMRQVLWKAICVLSHR